MLYGFMGFWFCSLIESRLSHFQLSERGRSSEREGEGEEQERRWMKGGREVEGRERGKERERETDSQTFIQYCPAAINRNRQYTIVHRK